MSIAIRHSNDRAPAFELPRDWKVRRETRPEVIADLQQKPVGEINARFADGHRPYIAWQADAPIAWGWTATRTARIGELGSTFDVPPGQRYLWNFVTLPTHRGLGIYPRLLDEIVRAEREEADAFWVAYAPENHASGAGIRKAGFTDLAHLSFDADGSPALADIVLGGASVAATFLGLPVKSGLAKCWRCVTRPIGAAHACEAGPCACDYQQPFSGCAAPAA